MGPRAVVDPAELAAVAGRMVGLADQVHASIEVVEASARGVGGVNAGFVAIQAIGQFWAGWQPALLASGTRVAQFGDDLAASGMAWQQTDAAHAALFGNR